MIKDENKIVGEIIEGGHVNLTYGNPIQNISQIAVGQPVIGLTSDSTYKVCFGLLCTGIYSPIYGEFNINFSGRLNYSNGTPIIYSPVKITVKYLNYEYDKTNSTDGLGQFFIKLEDLPQVMMQKDLDITISVQSNIEAIYNCYYNFTEGYCCKQPGPKSCKPP